MFISEQLVQAFVIIVVINIAVIEVAVFLLWRRRPANAAATTAAQAGAAASMASPAPGLSAADGLDGAGPGEPTAEHGAEAAVGDGTHYPDHELLVDPVTGLETGLIWHDAVRHEDARRARYGHSATVVVLDLVGFEQLVERLGSDVAERLIVPVAATLVRSSRASDRVARLGHTRFAVLMPETDEVSAINYVDRVREATDMWLEAGAVAVRTAIGWASPPSGGSLVDALRLADERMVADRHARPRPRTTPRPQASMRAPVA